MKNLLGWCLKENLSKKDLNIFEVSSTMKLETYGKIDKTVLRKKPAKNARKIVVKTKDTTANRVHKHSPQVKRTTSPHLIEQSSPSTSRPKGTITKKTNQVIQPSRQKHIQNSISSKKTTSKYVQRDISIQSGSQTRDRKTKTVLTFSQEKSTEQPDDKSHERKLFKNPWKGKDKCEEITNPKKQELGPVKDAPDMKYKTCDKVLKPLDREIVEKNKKCLVPVDKDFIRRLEKNIVADDETILQITNPKPRKVIKQESHNSVSTNLNNVENLSVDSSTHSILGGKSYQQLSCELEDLEYSEIEEEFKEIPIVKQDPIENYNKTVDTLRKLYKEKKEEIDGYDSDEIDLMDEIENEFSCS